MAMLRDAGKVAAALTAFSLTGCSESAAHEPAPAISATRDARSSLVRLEHLIPEQSVVEGLISSGQGDKVVAAVRAAREQYKALGEALNAMETAATSGENKQPK